jgi:hypothetical protein
MLVWYDTVRQPSTLWAGQGSQEAALSPRPSGPRCSYRSPDNHVIATGENPDGRRQVSIRRRVSSGRPAIRGRRSIPVSSSPCPVEALLRECEYPLHHHEEHEGQVHCKGESNCRTNTQPPPGAKT